MGGILVVVGSNIPVGYTVPSFPSLYFPFASDNQFQLSYLYYTYDIWRFTLFWTLIFTLSFHMCSAVIAAVFHRKFVEGVWIIFVYTMWAGVQGFISGSVTGLMLAAVYRAGMFGMTTWMPLIWALIQVLYMVISSYSMMSTTL